MRLFGINQDNPLKFFVSGQLISNDSFIHMKRKFNDNVLIFVLEGNLYINSNNHNYKITKNQFIFLKAGEEHFGYKTSEGFLTYYWVHFQNTPEEIDKDNKDNFSYLFPEYGSIENPARMILIFKQIMDYSLENNFYNNKVLDYTLSILMMELSQNYIKSISKENVIQNPLINDICNWIKNNFQRDFSIDELAENFNLQSSYISRLFKMNMGKSLIQYITEIRIVAAKNLLQTFTIKETAYSCGFCDEKYFMKVFKKSEGITPTQFKQAFSLRNINQ